MIEYLPLTVGVTGHRPNRIQVRRSDITRRIAWVLVALRKGYPGHRCFALSALAEGADRLFAAVALRTGYNLCALLPFERAAYERTFTDPTTTPDYRDLLNRASSVRELSGRLSDTKAAYEAVGQALVAASDVLVAVWDGKPAAGRGGTPDVIELALAQEKPVVAIDSARRRLPRLITRNLDRHSNNSARPAQIFDKGQLANLLSYLVQRS